MKSRDERIEDIRSLVKIQCSKGNYDCNEYMFGLANGLILALATMEGKSPVYMDKPTRWLDDLPRLDYILGVD